MTPPDAAGGSQCGALVVRPPRQQRSREAWSRVLDAGVALLEEGGYEAFTIAAVCDRAQVAPRALYARVDTKEALFLAVYEHGMARLRADQAVLTDGARWSGLPAERLATEAVRAVAGVFLRHAPLLRSVVLVSGAHPEVHRRGAAYAQELGDAFAALLLRHRTEIDHEDAEAAVQASFTALFSSLVLRTAYGPGFAGPAVDDEALVGHLAGMVSRHLFRR